MPMYIVCYEISANAAPDMVRLRRIVDDEFDHDEAKRPPLEEGRSSDYDVIYKVRDELGGQQLLTSTFAVNFAGTAIELRDHVLSQFPQELKDRLGLLVFDSSNLAGFPDSLHHKILESSAV